MFCFSHPTEEWTGLLIIIRASLINWHFFSAVAVGYAEEAHDILLMGVPISGLILRSRDDWKMPSISMFINYLGCAKLLYKLPRPSSHYLTANRVRRHLRRRTFSSSPFYWSKFLYWGWEYLWLISSLTTSLTSSSDMSLLARATVTRDGLTWPQKPIKFFFSSAKVLREFCETFT